MGHPRSGLVQLPGLYLVLKMYNGPHSENMACGQIKKWISLKTSNASAGRFLLLRNYHLKILDIVSTIERLLENNQIL